MTNYPKLTLALTAMLLYLPTLFFGWVFLDDYLIVQESGFFAKLSNIPASFLRSVWHPTGTEYNYYRPASTSVYILGASVSQWLSQDILPWIFHLTNILLHGLVAPLLFAVFRRIGGSQKTALIAALVLVIHPATAGTLGWISGQNELLLALWVLCGFVCFNRALHAPLWFLPHALCFLLALLTKENGVILPVLCALYLALSPLLRARKNWIGAALAWTGTAVIWFLLLRQGGGQAAPSAGGALTAMWNGLPYLLVYLGKLVLPVGLTTLSTPQDTAWFTWLAGTLAAIMLLIFTLFTVRRRPMVLVGLAWFMGFLLPTFANLVPGLKNSFILRADRAYLASAGLLIVLLQVPWPAKISLNQKALLGALACAFLTLNLFHQFDYADGMSFYQSAVKGAPRSSFAHTHLADMYLKEKDFPRAIGHYQKAISLNEFEPQAHNNLGVAYLRTGQLEKAAGEFKAELKHNPSNLLSWSNLATIYFRAGDMAAAEQAFRRAVEINPAYKDAWAGLVEVYTHLKQTRKRDEALKMLNQAEMDLSRGI